MVVDYIGLYQSTGLRSMVPNILGAILIVSMLCQIVTGLLILICSGGEAPYSMTPGSTSTAMAAVGVIEAENMVLSQAVIRLWHSVC